MQRYPLIIGNWKLNGNKHMVIDLIKKLCLYLSNVEDCNVAIAPPLIYLQLAKENILNNNIELSAQNVDINLSGAFTGETSASMLKDIGVKYVIIGHSERRIYHKESDELIAKKFAVLKKVGLIPVFCIGETKGERKDEKTEEVCARQINSILETQGPKAFKNTVIAYEPIWAIGTGLSATPEQAQNVHQFIRKHIAKKDATIAEQIIIQYGGSVNEKTSTDLLNQPDIDGLLVGGSALKADTFVAIIKSAT